LSKIDCFACDEFPRTPLALREDRGKKTPQTDVAHTCGLHRLGEHGIVLIGRRVSTGLEKFCCHRCWLCRFERFYLSQLIQTPHFDGKLATNGRDSRCDRGFFGQPPPLRPSA
jgi:hypothetical protein